MVSAELVFVYGSLKRGHALHYLLQHQTFLGVATTRPVYRLFDLGEYPGLVDLFRTLPEIRDIPMTGCAIEGEVYAVTDQCLRQLDDAEGVADGLYERRAVLLSHPPELLPGTFRETRFTDADVLIWAWFYRGSVHGRPDCGPRWPRV